MTFNYYKLYLLNKRSLLKHFKDIDGLILMSSGRELYKYNTDEKYEFYQESNFKYLFGVDIPDCYGAINLYTQETILFLPQLTDHDELLENFDNLSPTNIKKKYPVDIILPKNLIRKYITDIQNHHHSLVTFVLADNLFFPPTNPIIDDLITYNTTKLHYSLTECRVIKNPIEIQILKHVNAISSNAHINTMKYCKKHISENPKESHLSNYFCFITSSLGCPYQAYPPIASACGNASYLHYNNKTNGNNMVHSKDFILVDMGAKSDGYISDISCSYPAGGKFTPLQNELYNIILYIHNTIIGFLKPDVNWTDLEIIVHHILTTELIKCGIITTDYNTAINKKLSMIFMPHRLGHFIGLDTHDVGDLYTHHQILKTGMVVAVEPGIYFMKKQLNKIYQHINIKKIKIYMNDGIGGIRIESNIVITPNGHTNLTTVPRSIKHIEYLMNNLYS